MTDTTMVIELQAGRAPMIRNFQIHFTATRAGYEARVMEHTNGLAPVALRFPIRQEIDPASFYRFRPHYRTELFEQVKSELMSGRVQRLKHGETGPEVDAFLRANLRGWPAGHPDAVDDNLTGWDPHAAPTT